MSEFSAAWWCRNRHLQTIWGPLFRRQRLAFRRERFVLADGDFVDLDWLDAPAPVVADPGAGAPHARALPRGVAATGRARIAGGSDAPARTDIPPLLLVLHGLEGSSSSHYVVGLLAGARARGWRGLALNFRSCSGEMNRLPRFYHSGDTADLDATVRLLVEREPGVRIGIVGISLGANVLLKWLGEQGASAPAAVVAGVGISVPFDLASCARVLDRGFGKHVYTANFLRSMRSKAVAKARLHPGYVDLAAVRRARTFRAYDRAVTAPLFGFADERDYWRRASCRPFLAAIERPVLVLNAADDPFVPPDALPRPAELAPAVQLQLTARGGHVGFVDGVPWAADSWAERRALAYLAPHLGD